MRSTKEPSSLKSTGDIGEKTFDLLCARMGWELSRPDEASPRAPYDRIIQRCRFEGPVKVQCKESFSISVTPSTGHGKSYIYEQARNSKRGGTGYSDGDYDFLFVLRQCGKMYLFPWNYVCDKKTLNFTTSDWAEIFRIKMPE